MKMSQTTPNFQWVRPVDVVPYPNVWQEFECKESKNSDKLVKYRIQDLPEDRFDDAIKHLMENYLPDEPISVACGKIDTYPERKCESQWKVHSILFSPGQNRWHQ